MATKNYALVCIVQKKDHTIDEMSLINVSTNKKVLEKQIAEKYAETKNDKWENFSILSGTEDEFKCISKMSGRILTYKLLEK